MKIRIWGARGSIPSPLQSKVIEDKITQAIQRMPALDPADTAAVQAYVQSLPPLLRGTAGGNTSCIEIQAQNTHLIIDAGSGLRELGDSLMAGPFGRGEGELHLIFSHAHWDHIQGFPFFKPAFIPGNRITIYSFHDLENVLTQQQEQPLFPVPLSYMQADIRFKKFEPGQPFSIGSLHINSLENHHPGRSFAFRISDRHSTFVFASDAEYKNLDAEHVQPHVAFFHNADALIFDAQYTLQEAWTKVDWGHSSALIGVDLARAAGVKRLILFHHDPTYSDTQLQEILDTAIDYQAQDKSRPPCEVMIGQEGLTLDLTPDSAITWEFMPDREAAIITPATVFDEQEVAHLNHQLDDLAENDPRASSIIDLSQVERLTTASLKLLVSHSKANNGRPIILIAPSEAVTRVIELSGYADFFAIYPNISQAFAALQARKALNLPGQIVAGRYQIERTLGESRLGTVLQARDGVSGKTVAVKIFALSFRPETINRYLELVPGLTRLEHPQIARVIDAGRDGEHAYVVQEMLNGTSLAERLADTEQPLLADEAFDIALDITLALEHAHAQRIIHGDLKPENVFLTDDGVKVADFGFGRLEEGRNLLNASLRYLTATHLAPEQILGESIDARTDLYALGVIFYQLFTGQLPFSGDDAEIMRSHLEAQPRPPRTHNPEVSPSLEHLILKLLAKNPNDRYASAEQAHRISNNLIVSAGDTGRQRQEALVGRSRPLQLLASRWEQAQTGRGSIVFVSGEAGVGKSSLALEAASQNNAPVLLIGHCQPQRGSPAYHPLSEALHAYFATVPPEVLLDELRDHLGILVRLMPELRQVLPNVNIPAPLEPKQEQLRLMSSLTQFLQRATADRPWFLVLEDLQWADQCTLDFLNYLGHYLPQLSLLIVGTYRDSEVDASHPLRPLLQKLGTPPSQRQIVLDRLDPNEVEMLLALLWHQPPPADLVRKVYEHTEGNPFYVREIVQNLINEGLVTGQPGAWTFASLEDIALPPSIHEAVWNRVRFLSLNAQTLLAQAAVLGPSFKFDDLLEMSGLSEWELLEHLDVALERQLIQESPGDMSLRFTHAEIHQVLYDDMGPLRRRMRHKQAGEAIERRAMPEPERYAEKLAYHFQQAGEIDRALVYGIQAARRAQANYANEAALQWYQQTLDLLNQLSPRSAEQFQVLTCSVHQYLGEVFCLIGQYDDALRHYQNARDLLIPDDREGQRQQADLYRLSAEVFEKQAKYTTALEWVQRGLDLLPEDKISTTMARLYQLGARLYEQVDDNLETAKTWAQKSLQIALQVDDETGLQAVGKSYYLLGIIHSRQGDFENEIALCRESLRIFTEIGDLVGQATVYNNMGSSYLELGEWDAALEAYTQSLTLAQQVSDIELEAMVTANLGLIRLNQGRWDEARNFLEHSFKIWEQINLVRGQAIVLSDMGRLHTHLHNWSEAQACLTRSQSIFNDMVSSEFMAELAYRWADFYLQTDCPDQAMEHVQRSIDLAVELGSALSEAKAQRLLGRIHLSQDKQAQAERPLRQSLETLSRLNSKYEMAKTQLSLAELALESAHLQDARHYLNLAIDTFERLGAQQYLHRARNLAAQLPPETNNTTSV